MKTCILCGQETSGSIGAAGYSWSFICQPCKDAEDKGLERMLEYQGKVMGKIEDLLTKLEIDELPTDDLCERSFCSVVSKIIDILRKEA